MSGGVEFCPRCDEVEIQSVDKYVNDWGYDEENQRNCIMDKKNIQCNINIKRQCKFIALGYNCCKETKEIVTSDDDGFWGIENGKWCGFKEDYPCSYYEQKGIKCCEDQSLSNLEFVDYREDGKYVKGTFVKKDGELCGLNSIVIF